MADTENTNQNPSASPSEATFVINRIVTRESQFTAPNTPAIFQNEWKPEANVALNTNTNQIDDTNYEITLTVNVSCKNADQDAFVVEAKVSGYFTIAGVSAQDLGPLLGSYCPATIFPYAREIVSNLVIRGGFPELSLSPINFDALYMQQQQQAAQEAQPSEAIN